MTLISAHAVLMFVAYVVTGAMLVGAFVFLYEKLTPYHEFEMIEEGNVAASISIVGAMIGFALPIGAVMIHAQWLDVMIQWSVIALAAQFAAYVAVTFVLHGVTAKMNEGNVAAGTFLCGVHLTTGILIAAGMVE
jgi:putative membrane protein